MSALRPLDLAYLAAIERGELDTADRLAAVIDAEQTDLDVRLSGPGALAAAAQWYAARGHLVFPCVPGGKTPITRHGFKDATTDPDRIAAWWEATPDANVALPTGHRFDVIDLDGSTGIVAFHDWLDSAARRPGFLARASTPRGRHYYVPARGTGNRARFLPGVDYRGTGGYVVAPPSRTTDGTYRWMEGEHLT